MIDLIIGLGTSPMFTLALVFSLAVGGVVHYFYPELPAGVKLLASVATFILLGMLDSYFSGPKSVGK